MRPEDASEGLRRLLYKAVAAVGLLVLAWLALAEWSELRGELAFARFLHFQSLAQECVNREERAGALEQALAETEVIMTCCQRNPDALQEVAKRSLRWLREKDMDPVLCLRMAETAVQAAALSVRAAPSDFEPWLWLARAYAALGLDGQSRVLMNRAEELVLTGKESKMLEW